MFHFASYINHSVQNSPGGGGLLTAHGLFPIVLCPQNIAQKSVLLYSADVMRPNIAISLMNSLKSAKIYSLIPTFDILRCAYINL